MLPFQIDIDKYISKMTIFDGLVFALIGGAISYGLLYIYYIRTPNKHAKDNKEQKEK
ncbi:MAG: hypothetical protein HW384_2185 [Dehalococcoidia bacterium]|nr:hypothetical protein [Dehalococcoidia bacterium]